MPSRKRKGHPQPSLPADPGRLRSGCGMSDVIAKRRIFSEAIGFKHPFEGFDMVLFRGFSVARKGLVSWLFELDIDVFVGFSMFFPWFFGRSPWSRGAAEA